MDNKVIKSVSLSFTSASPKSMNKQQMFEEKLNKNSLIGKDISLVDIENVTGATWTTDAFKSVIKDVAAKL